MVANNANTSDLKAIDNIDNINAINKTLERFNLPKLKDINIYKQGLALILINGKYCLLLLAFMLLMPYGTPEMNGKTGIVYPDAGIAILSNGLIMMSFVAAWGWGKLLYRMTYKDVVKMIEKAEANRLFSSEIAETLILLVWKAKELRDKEKNIKKERTIRQYEAMLKKRGLDISLEKLLKDNEMLHSELNEFKEIKETIEQEVAS